MIMDAGKRGDGSQRTDGAEGPRSMLDRVSEEQPLSAHQVDDLVAMARRLATRRLYREGSALLRVADQIHRGHPEVRQLLSQIEVLEDRQPHTARLDDRTMMAFRRQTIDAAHFLGLAALYADRGEMSAALECLEMSKHNVPSLPYAYKLHGKLLLRQRDYDGAARELNRALRFNPFDPEIAELLGNVEYERERFEPSLSYTVDAFLLEHDEHSRTAERLRRRVRTLRRRLDWDTSRFVELFHQRQQRLETAYDRLQWRRDLFLVDRGLLAKGLLFATQRFHEGGNRISLAGRLREMPQLRHLSDESVFQMTAAAREEPCGTNTILFQQGSSSRDVFLLERGDVLVRRLTPYGDFALSQLRGRELFGDIAYVDHRGRTAEAIALTECQLLRLDAETLDDLVEDRPEIGVQLYSGLWHNLATNLRKSNRRLESFLPFESKGDRLAEPAAAGRSVRVPNDDKIRLFREQGLTSRELLTLATYSSERHYAAETFLFREGDPGEEMYFVLEGCIRISKFIPGVGEEALAILGRGEFFGEMSLIDGQPRSADARTHAGAATVLALDRERVTAVLARDPRSALEFLRLLCRILASRLRELDEKLVLWQILSLQDNSASRALDVLDSA